MTTKRITTVTAAIAAILAAATAGAVDLKQKFDFTIPAGKLSEALIEFSKQAHVQILAPGEGIAADRTTGVSGSQTVENALTELLKSSGLKFHVMSDTAIAVGEATPTAAVGAPALEKTSLRLAQNDNAGGGPGTGGAEEQNPSEISESKEESKLQEIVVVGSSIAVRRDKVESGALPIQLITSAELAASGSGTVQDFMRREPVFFGNSGEIGRFSAASTLNLRGIGDQYTLTLVNGRRTGINGPANIAAIPFDAIERVEVLKADASAIYGSDAVAGVVNFVLKTKEDGFGASARYGDAAGGYDERQFSVYMGAEGERGSYFASVRHREQGALLNSQRPGTASNNQTALGGYDFRSTSSLPAPIILPSGEVVIINTELFPVGTTSMDPGDYRPYDFDRDAHDRAATGTTLLGGNESTSFVFSGELNLSGKTRLLGDFLLDSTKDHSVSGTPTFSVTVPASNYYNPFGVDVVARYRGLDVLPSVYNNEADTRSGGLRLEHQLTERFELSAGANLTHIRQEEFIPTRYSTVGVLEAIARTTPDALNPFGNLANGPAQLLGVIVPIRNFDFSQLCEFDARISGRLFSLPSGDVRTVFGTAYRRESIHHAPDGLIRPGAGGAMDQSEEEEIQLGRNVKSAFAEIRVPLLAPSGDMVESPLEFGLAARYERYSDFGSTFDPLTSLRWAVTPDVALRASYNTSFRAPYLEDLIPNSTMQEADIRDPVTSAVIDAAAIFGGNPDLKSESADTISVGTILTPRSAPGLFVSLDYYRLNQKDAIIAPDPQSIYDGTIPGTVIFQTDIGPGGEDVLIIAELTNVAKRRVSGLDYSSRYDRELGDGSALSLDLAAHYLLSFRSNVLDGQGFVSHVGTFGDFGGLPKLRGTGGVSWSKGAYTLIGRANYVQGMHDVFAPTDDFRVSSFLTADLAVRFDVGAGKIPGVRQTSLTVGVVNALNEEIPYSPGNSGYISSIHDVRGRAWYASMNVRF